MRIVPALQLVTLSGVLAWLLTGSSESTDTRVDWWAVVQWLAMTSVLGVAWWLGHRLRPWERQDATSGERLVTRWLHRGTRVLWVLALALLVPVVVGEIVFDPIG